MDRKSNDSSFAIKRYTKSKHFGDHCYGMDSNNNNNNKKNRNLSTIKTEPTATTEKNIINNIVDILDMPDVAVWSKGIRSGIGVPSDRVREPSKIASTALLYVKEENPHDDGISSSNKGQGKAREGPKIIIDPANKAQMEKAELQHASLTDELEYVK
jgi:hypothetical protein